MSSTAERPRSLRRCERHCALTRELKPVDEMIRFVVGPGGDAVPDVKRKLPGRGLWITGTRAAIDEAVKRNVFARGFKRERAGRRRSGGHDRAAAGAQRARRAGDRRQGRAGGRRFRQGRSGDRPRRPAGADPCRRWRGRRKAQAGRRPWRAKPRENRAKSRSSRPLPAPNWIWHWAAQMWYMQPCLPGP